MQDIPVFFFSRMHENTSLGEMVDRHGCLRNVVETLSENRVWDPMCPRNLGVYA